jgi:ABC-type transport system substrate-binding protein
MAVLCTLWTAACGGNARRTDTRQPLTIRIGTFLANTPGQLRVSDLAGILSAEPLVAVAWDGRPVFRLAESAGESADGLALTVTLRPNAKFHSGEPVTAAAVRELLVPQLAKRTEVTDVQVRDERTLVVRLNRPHSFKVVDLSDYSIDDAKRVELRTGPFRVLSEAPEVVLERFPDYHQGTPTVQRIEIKEFATHRMAWTAMMRGEVNFLHEVSRDAIDFIQAGGDIRAYPLLRPYYVPLVFNQKHPILRRREVRIALNEAVDRQEVVHTGMRGHGEPAEGPFWPYHWAYPQGHDAVPYNPEAAKVRLDAAGLRVRDSTANTMPSRFAFTCLVPLGDTRFERISLVVQRQLFSIGVDMQLKLVPISQFSEQIMKGDFEAFIFEMASARTLSFPYRFWHSENGALPTGYAAANDALDRMKFANSDEDVRAGVADVLRVMRADPPAVFLAFPREARAADASLAIPHERDRDVLGTLWQAQPAALASSEVPR